jgi:hypothetical protein
MSLQSAVQTAPNGDVEHTLDIPRMISGMMATARSSLRSTTAQTVSESVTCALTNARVHSREVCLHRPDASTGYSSARASRQKIPDDLGRDRKAGQYRPQRLRCVRGAHRPQDGKVRSTPGASAPTDISDAAI